MSGVSPGLTLPQAINNSEAVFQRLLRSGVTNTSRVRRPSRDHDSVLLRAELIHIGNVRTRALLTTRDVQVRNKLIRGPRNVMEEKHQEEQESGVIQDNVELNGSQKNTINQTLSKIGDKLTSLFSKKNLASQGTDKIQSSTRVSNPALVNQNVYPVTGNVAASTQTNTAISLQAGQTPAEAAINIINLNSPEVTQQLPMALSRSIDTLNKVSKEITPRSVNASLL